MLNKAILVGRLTADPELKQTPNGLVVTTFRIAIDRAFTAKNTERQADFINIVAWRTSAEFVCKYFKKGSAIGIDGSIQTRDYTDKEGKKRTVFEVVAERVSFVERRQSGTSEVNSTESVSAPASIDANLSFDAGDLIDDLPF